MSNVFEDKFMDLQSSMIALCQELVSDVMRVDVIYALCNVDGNMLSFNAFYQANGKVYTLSNLGLSRSMISQFFDCGMEDIGSMIELCKEYGRKMPAEIRMTYCVGNGAFTADYEYNQVLTDEIGIHDRYMMWVKSVDPNYGKPVPPAKDKDAQSAFKGSSAMGEQPKKKDRPKDGRGWKNGFFSIFNK